METNKQQLETSEGRKSFLKNLSKKHRADLIKTMKEFESEEIEIQKKKAKKILVHFLKMKDILNYGKKFLITTYKNKGEKILVSLEMKR
ncbi:MAG: hypothetical protein NTY80_02035 [candidate division SR1 bacterium]|nr:hypothetical protein [candidate division SR1 bacterium]